MLKNKEVLFNLAKKIIHLKKQQKLPNNYLSIIKQKLNNNNFNSLIDILKNYSFNTRINIDDNDNNINVPLSRFDAVDNINDKKNQINDKKNQINDKKNQINDKKDSINNDFYEKIEKIYKLWNLYHNQIINQTNYYDFEKACLN
jgi:hypothetical protein